MSEGGWIFAALWLGSGVVGVSVRLWLGRRRHCREICDEAVPLGIALGPTVLVMTAADEMMRWMMDGRP